MVSLAEAKMATHGLSHSPAAAARAASRQTSSDPIRDLLLRYRTLAVVGLSPKPSRPSHGVAAYMRAHGYRIIGVNPSAKSVFGDHCYAALEDVPDAFDVVVIFRRSEFVPAIVESAIRVGAKVIWMQEGITSPAAAQVARKAGIEVVEDRCILKEHAKRFVTDGI